MALGRHLNPFILIIPACVLIILSLFYYSEVKKHDWVVEQAQKMFIPEQIFTPAQERPPHRMSTGMCREMFTITKPYAGNRHKSRIKDIVTEVVENVQKEFAWSVKPYRELSHFLPSMIQSYKPKFPLEELIKKYSRNLTGKRQEIESILQRQRSGDDFSLDSDATPYIKLNMLNNQKHFSYKLKAKGNRLEQLDGQLPFVPCRVKTKYDLGELRQCFQTATELRETPYTIVFMGDSKSRQLFDTFMMETRDLNYTITSRGKQRSLINSFLKFDPEAPYVVATPAGLPHLRLVHVYERFHDMKLTLLSRNKALLQLEAWASGVEPPPDVLVISYGDWLFLNSNSLQNVTLTVLDSLDFSWTIHDLVTRLLARLSRTTHVLLQGRLKQRLNATVVRSQMFAYKSMSEDVISWSYRQLMYLWRKLAPERETESLLGNTLIKRELHTRSLKISKLTAAILRNLRKKNEMKKLKNSPRHRDSTVRQNNDEGELLFWDSTLPLTQATMAECETLFRHDPETAALLYKLQTLAPFRGVRYMIGMLIMMDVNSTEIVAKLRGPADQVDQELSERLASDKDHKYFALFKAILSESLTNFTAVDDYFSDYAVTFAMPELNCMDFNHPSMSTMQVEISQLLNLACNPYLNLSPEYCCTK